MNMPMTTNAPRWVNLNEFSSQDLQTASAAVTRAGDPAPRLRWWRRRRPEPVPVPECEQHVGFLEHFGERRDDDAVLDYWADQAARRKRTTTGS
jgi:hypothetical protein